MNVLSLFDGISCGRIALERAGIPVTNYFASEIDPYCIQISKRHYPDIKNIGDVTKLTYHEFLTGRFGFKTSLHNDTMSVNGKIDLLIGGSPCQGFSFSGKQANFIDPRSKLFFEFARILLETNPKYFLLENVMMKKEYQNIISKHMGVDPICINSNLVSAQNRKRLYWTNIPNILNPENKGIFLKDIINDDAVPVTLTETRTEEAKKIRKEYQKQGRDFSPRRAKVLVPRIDGKSNCLTATVSSKEHLIQLKSGHYGCLNFDGKDYRYLNVSEWEALQGLPNDYTSGLKDRQRYKMIGNGWNIPTIIHIFLNIPL